MTIKMKLMFTSLNQVLVLLYLLILNSLLLIIRYLLTIKIKWKYKILGLEYKIELFDLFYIYKLLKH